MRMIYVIEKIQNDKLRLERYQSLVEVANSLELQDVYGKAYTIISEDGVIYDCDRTLHSKDFGTTYGYTLIRIGIDNKLAVYCRQKFAALGWPDEIENVE
jgi:hypothetical protein